MSDYRKNYDEAVETFLDRGEDRLALRMAWLNLKVAATNRATRILMKHRRKMETKIAVMNYEVNYRLNHPNKK